MEDKEIKLTAKKIEEIFYKQPLILYNSNMKTFKYWDINFDGTLDKYLGNTPCEIDEELFLYFAEVTACQYSS